MNGLNSTNPVTELSSRAGAQSLVLNVYPTGDSCVVNASGELDLTTRNQLFAAVTAGNHRTMVIDLAKVTFMDCSGYGSLMASRAVLEGQARRLTVRGQSGEPARLMALIAEMEPTTTTPPPFGASPFHSNHQPPSERGTIPAPSGLLRNVYAVPGTV